MKKLLSLIPYSLFLTPVLCSAQSIISVAGANTAGYNGDGKKAYSAQLNQVGGVAVDDSGNIYIADSQNNRIRKVYKKNGVIVTIAGTGDAGYSGDSGKATLAMLAYPICVRVDSLHNVYFSDAGNAAVRKILAKSGKICTIAGNGNGGYSGDSGLAVKANLNYPVGIALDKDLNVYIADQNNNVIRKVTAATGIINTVAGNHNGGYSGNAGDALAASLNHPTGVAVDRAGNMYIADFNNNVVRVVNPSGVISNFAGTGTAGFNGYQGLADTTKLTNPAGISTDAAGNVYIADAGDGVVRVVLTSTHMMYVIAGNANDGYSGDGGPSIKAQVSYPFDIMPDNRNNIYIADLGNNRVRKITIAQTR